MVLLELQEGQRPRPRWSLWRRTWGRPAENRWEKAGIPPRQRKGYLQYLDAWMEIKDLSEHWTRTAVPDFHLDAIWGLLISTLPSVDIIAWMILAQRTFQDRSFSGTVLRALMYSTLVGACKYCGWPIFQSKRNPF
jgi:hypothetical protein